MTNPDDIAVALCTVLPMEHHAAAYALAAILSDIANQRVSEDMARSHIVTDPRLKMLLEALQGRQIEVGQAAVNFGSNSQFGDVSMRDVVNGNIIHLTINLGDQQARPLITDAMPNEYALDKIHDLLVAAYSADELRRLCRYHFRSVMVNLGPDASANSIAERLLAYCDAHDAISALLARVATDNPAQWVRYQSLVRREA
jgi:hypothetical protein